MIVDLHRGTLRQNWDRQCSEPYCHLPAVACEQDHLAEHGWGGPTLPHNLDQKCAHGHRLKDVWDVFAMGAGDQRVMVWISRLGHCYWTQPPPVFDPTPLPWTKPVTRATGEQHCTPGQVPDWLLAPWDDDPFSFNEVQTYLAAQQRRTRHTNNTKTPKPEDDPPPF